MRQAVLTACLGLMVTITTLLYVLNSATARRISVLEPVQYAIGQEHCTNYNVQKTGTYLNTIFAVLSDNLPPEDQWEKLLKQPDGIGASLTHDVAIKARDYSNLFEPWAELHLSLGDNRFHSREDVVQYLQCQANIVPQATGMNQSQILKAIQLYDTYRWLVTNMGQTLFPWTAPYFPDHLSLYMRTKNGGKGIVFTVGNGQVSYILTSIVTLRKLGCDLPIEVMYQGDKDLHPKMRQRIEAYPGVVTRNLEHMIHTSNGWKFVGFDMKPFAMLVSSFREVILVDADVGFLQNPETMFLDDGYVETGTLFFYDRIHSKNEKRTEWLYTAMPQPFSERLEQKLNISSEIGATREDQESGVVVFDKSRNFIALLLIAWLNGPNRHGSDDELEHKGFYDVYYGDKDSYWFGMELAGSSNYSFSTGSLACTGNLTQIVQYTGDLATIEAIKVDEYAYNYTDVVDTWKSNPHFNRTISIYDRDVRVCSYQMIHMDRNQTPLWYNGWISDKKRPTLEMRNLWEFEQYMIENPVLTGENPWTWIDGFKGCLDGWELVSFTESEKNVFQNARQAAIDLGIVINRYEQNEFS